MFFAISADGGGKRSSLSPVALVLIEGRISIELRFVAWVRVERVLSFSAGVDECGELDPYLRRQ